MKKKYLIIPALVAMSLCACNQATTVTETTVAAENTVDGFSYDNDTMYTLYLPEQGFVDITKYIVTGDTPDIYVTSNILTDVFGYKTLNRDNGNEESEITYREFQDSEENLLQLEENGTSIIHNGNARYCAQPMKVDGDHLDIKLLDLIIGLGYEKMDQSSSNNNIITIAYRSAMDPTMELVYDNEGNLITDPVMAEEYVASMSNAIADMEETVSETEAETEATQIEETAVPEETEPMPEA